MATPADTEALVTSLSDFTLDIYRVLSEKKPSENLFFSPLSVMTALGMTLMGSKANTHKQLKKVLRLDQDDDEVKQAFAALVAKYKGGTTGCFAYLFGSSLTDAFAALVAMCKGRPSGCELRTTNMMYSSNHVEMQQSFTDTITRHFHASAKVVDFGGQTEKVRQEINAAVEKETNEKITNLIEQGVLDSLTRLVLVNAVYFKGQWVEAFKKSDTHDGPFYTSETDTVQVPMMHLTSYFQYKVRKNLEATVLILEYKDSSLSLVVVLPDSRTGLAVVEGKLTGEVLRELCKPGYKQEVVVTLPRFKLKWQEDLVAALKQLGASDLFSEGVSDLSGIGGPPGYLCVSKVLHKTFLDVNEEGTEAAAATVDPYYIASMVSYTPHTWFVADRPFLAVIVDTATLAILFLGRVSRPGAAQ